MGLSGFRIFHSYKDVAPTGFFDCRELFVLKDVVHIGYLLIILFLSGEMAKGDTKNENNFNRRSEIFHFNRLTGRLPCFALRFYFVNFGRM
jgi:hypothetical protein